MGFKRGDVHLVNFNPSTGTEAGKLKENYGEPYNPAYDEIRKTLDNLGFSWVQGSLYLARSDMNSLTAVYRAIETLKKIDWFKKSVHDIRAFKIEDWSDFTQIVKE